MAEGSTRERLLSAALDLFSVKGYAASSVDEIAESIGIKGPNIYKYFKGKQGLFDELTHTCEDGYKKSMGMEAKSRIKINSARELKEFSMHQISFTFTDDTVKKLRKMLNIEQYRSVEMSRMATYHQYGNMMDLYTGIFRHLVDNGMMKQSDPEILALEYIAPTALLIQICDREPDRLAEMLAKAEKSIDMFIEAYFVPTEE